MLALPVPAYISSFTHKQLYNIILYSFIGGAFLLESIMIIISGQNSEVVRYLGAVSVLVYGNSSWCIDCCPYMVDVRYWECPLKEVPRYILYTYIIIIIYIVTHNGYNYKSN